jgi:2-dehydro-3-deoxygalactonokinase
VHENFLSCDWGTTSFRLRHVRGVDCTTLREAREPVGIKTLYDSAGVGASEAERAPVFSRFLRAQLEKLLAAEAMQRPWPLVISGMASSSVGWRELPYASTPFPLDGQGLVAEELHWEKPAWLGATYLISGVATQHEMMRGEETEILGLMANPDLAAGCQRSWLILPGTHSKHVRIDEGRVVDFHTFMTGELFEVLGRQSLLRASVDPGARLAAEALSDDAQSAFREGALWTKNRGLAAGLFRVRTRAVLDQRPPANNTWFFSGLLIGSELAHLDADADRPVIVAAGRHLAGLYALALEALGHRNWLQLPAEQVEQAPVIAHASFLQQKVRAG